MLLRKVRLFGSCQMLIIFLVLRSTGKMADFLLHRCASLEGLIPFILQNFEIPPVTSSIETVKDDKERSSELVSLACSTGKNLILCS